MIERPVLRELLIERARSGSMRGKRTEPYHIALVVECGGMRGAAASGAVQALDEANCLNAFDTFHGASAGACAAAYFMTGQSQEGRKIYFEDICNRRVVNPYRFWSRPCMVDTDYIGDTVIGQIRSIDSDRIISEPGVLNVVTSAVHSGIATVHSHFRSRAEIITAMKATLRVPGLREPGVGIGGDLHLDGGVTAPIPIFSALNRGATHILVVGTQRMSDYCKTNTLVETECKLLRLLYGRRLAESYRAVNSETASALRHSALSEIECVMLARPAGSTFCAWHTIDTSVLEMVDREARLATRAFLSGSATSTRLGLANGVSA